MTGERRKIAKNVTLDEDLIKVMDKTRGYEPLSSYANRILRRAHGLPEA